MIKANKESIDVLTEAGELTGRVLPRDVIHREGHWHRTVHIWVVNDKAQILIQKRSPDVEINPGLWDISAAGHIPAGEGSKPAAIRELAEELGILVTEDELTFLFTVKNTTNTHNQIDKAYNDVYLIERSIDIEDLTCQVEEVSAAKWVDINTIASFTDDPEMVDHQEEYRRLSQYFSSPSSA